MARTARARYEMDNEPAATRKAAAPAGPLRKPPGVMGRLPPQNAPESRVDAQRSVVQQIALRHLKRFISLEPAALQGDDSEAIHDIRVASRRVQQVIDLLYPKPRPAKIRKLRRTVRRSRSILSDVRNYDVLLERAEKTLRRKRLARREVWAAFRKYLTARREESFEKAAARLGKLNLPGCFVQLKSQIEKRSDGALPEEAGVSAAAARGSASFPFHDVVVNSLRQNWSALESCIEQARQEPSTAGLHALRIAGKRLRYLVEAMAEMDVPGSSVAVERLRQMQQHLGDWHDEEVLCQTMLQMVASPGFLEERLELCLETEKLVLRYRNGKLKFEAEFLKTVDESLRGLASWCESFTPSPTPPSDQEPSPSAS
jgi:CHAD domain-containing protein